MTTSKPRFGKKTAVPFWRRPQGPIVSFMRQRDRLVVDFAYTPERVAAIKAISGARYHAEDKSWSVPLGSADSLLESKVFPTTSRLSGVSSLETDFCDPSQAWEELRADPFSVREEVLASITVDLLVRFNREKRRIKVIPRIGSSALRIVKRTRGVVFSAFDSAYVLPVEEISRLLKKLRDKHISFAIDQEAGRALTDSATLRRSITKEPHIFCADDFSAALLTPFITAIDTEDRHEFRPCFFTTEQFALAFPGVKRQHGAIFTLDEQKLLQFIGRVATLPFPVWLTREIHAFVRVRREQLLLEAKTSQGPLDDLAAELAELPLVWRTAQSGRGVLTVRLPEGHEIRERIIDQLQEVTGSTYAREGDVLLLEVPDSRLQLALHEIQTLCETSDLCTPAKSRSFEKLELDTKQRGILRERSAYYASLDDIDPGEVAGLLTTQSSRLFPHQRVAIEWLRRTPYAFLGDDMGLGKTLSVLSYYVSLRTSEQFSMLVVVCPNSLTRNWAREAALWFPELRVSVLVGDKASKAWTLRLLTSGAAEIDLLVVNYEAVRLDYVVPELESIISARKSLLCLDESQRVKNPSAKTFKVLNQLAPSAERRVLLSGTPTPKDVSDLWAQMRILDGGQRFGKSFYKWLGKVAELGTEYSQYAVKKFHQDEVAESVLRAHEVMLRRRKERVVDLPPKIFSIREVALSGSQAERYDEVREGLILRMRSLSGEQFVREITNILEEYLRAVQIASNPRLVDPQWKGDPAKFLELDEIVHEVVHEQGQKLVVWTNYLGNVAELCERYKQFGTAPFSGEVSAADREKTVRGFQDSDKPSILVAVPAAGGVGITLTAAQTAVYIDKTWNAEHWMQSVDRIHRIGQTGTVHVLSLLSCKVDEVIHWNLRRKEQNQAQVLGDDKERDLSAFVGVTREELLQALDE